MTAHHRHLTNSFNNGTSSLKKHALFESKVSVAIGPPHKKVRFSKVDVHLDAASQNNEEPQDLDIATVNCKSTSQAGPLTRRKHFPEEDEDTTTTSSSTSTTSGNFISSSSSSNKEVVSNIYQELKRTECNIHQLALRELNLLNEAKRLRSQRVAWTRTYLRLATLLRQKGGTHATFQIASLPPLPSTLYA